MRLAAGEAFQGTRLLVCLCAALASACGQSTARPRPTEVRTPNPDVGVAALRARRKAQIDAASEQFKVFYQFADPKLEDLSAGQKLMVRMGSANERALKAKLRDFRTELVQSGAAGGGPPKK